MAPAPKDVPPKPAAALPIRAGYMRCEPPPPLAETLAGKADAIVDQLRIHLASRNCGPGYLLIHRTVEESCESILRTGFRTGIKECLHIDYSATVHQDVNEAKDGNEDFKRFLLLRHRSCTHHLIIHVPPHALSDLRDMMNERGMARKPTLNKLAYALGGTLPKEWVAGVYLVDEGRFVPNDCFDPAKRANLEKFHELEEYFQPVGPRRRPGGPLDL